MVARGLAPNVFARGHAKVGRPIASHCGGRVIPHKITTRDFHSEMGLNGVSQWADAFSPVQRDVAYGEWQPG